MNVLNPFSVGSLNPNLKYDRRERFKKIFLAVIAAHLQEPARPLTDLRADAPADLEAVVLRCLEKDPARRFADVGCLGKALASCACAGDWGEEVAARWWQAQPGRVCADPDGGGPP